MCPSVCAPSSPYCAASGVEPIPTESRTRRNARANPVLHDATGAVTPPLGSGCRFFQQKRGSVPGAQVARAVAKHKETEATGNAGDGLLLRFHASPIRKVHDQQPAARSKRTCTVVEILIFDTGVNDVWKAVDREHQIEGGFPQHGKRCTRDLHEQNIVGSMQLLLRAA